MRTSRTILCRWVVLLLAPLCLVARAETPSHFAEPGFGRWALDLHGGVALTQFYDSNIAGDLGVRPIGGSHLSWYFSRAVGLFGGFDVLSRGPAGIQLTTVDVPLGFIFRYRANGIFGGVLARTKLGGFYSMPFSDPKAANGTLLGKKQNAFGLILQSSSLFDVTDGFRMGPAGGLRLAFGSLASGVNVKPFDFLIALEAEFTL